MFDLPRNYHCSEGIQREHISFDFAQQVHIPHLPDEPGPMYFLTPYKIGLFGVYNKAAGIQVNYVIPENAVTGEKVPMR